MSTALGARLKVMQLAAELGTSEIPVCEAIIALAGSGLASIRPHVGAMATPLFAGAEEFKFVRPWSDWQLNWRRRT